MYTLYFLILPLECLGDFHDNRMVLASITSALISSGSSGTENDLFLC